MTKGPRITVGVISDTHGTLTEAAIGALAHADHILHAGDVVGDEVLTRLARIAATTAVRGNMDTAGRCRELTRTAVIELGGVRIMMLHNINCLDIDPAAAGIAVVVHGHTHRAEVRRQNGVLILNPGSAKPVGEPSVARLIIDDGQVSAEIIPLPRPDA